jgi:hypothetical protein
MFYLRRKTNFQRVAMIMGWIPDGSFDIHHALLLCASSMLTAAVASFVLGKSIMYGKNN